MDFCTEKNKFNDNIRQKKCIFSDDEISEITNRESLLQNMRNSLESYYCEEFDTPRWHPLIRDILLMANVNNLISNIEELSLSNIFEELPQENTNPIVDVNKDEEKLEIIFNDKLNDSIKELLEDIKSKHGYLLESSDQNTLKKHSNQSYNSTSINIRKLSRILETNRYSGRIIPKTFKNDIKIFMNNMHLPNQCYRVLSNVGEITNIQFFDNGKCFVVGTTHDYMRIFKYNDVSGIYQHDKVISFLDSHAITDILVSQKRDIAYVTSYSGILSEINFENLTSNEGFLERSVVVYPFDIDNVNDVKGICFKDPDEYALICASMDGNVYGSDIKQSQLLFKTQSHYCVKDVCMIAPDNSNVFVSAGPKRLNIFDARILGTESDVGSPIAIINDSSINFRYISPRGDGNYVVSTCIDNNIRIYDIRYTNKHIFDTQNDHVFNGFTGIGKIDTNKSQYDSTVCKAKFSPSHTANRFIYTRYCNNNVAIFDLYTGLKVKSIQCPRVGKITSIDWHPFKNEIAVGGRAGNIAYISDEENLKAVTGNDNELLSMDDEEVLGLSPLVEEYERNFPRL